MPLFRISASVPLVAVSCVLFATPPQPQPTIALLLQTAKASLPDVPSDIAVFYLTEIGHAESMRAEAGKTQPGLNDMAHAFDQAVQMSSGRDDDPDATFRNSL